MPDDNDDMAKLTTFDAHWRGLASFAYDNTAPPVLMTEYRRNFYAGAMVAFKLFQQASQAARSPDEFLQRMEVLEAELGRFKDALPD